MMYYDCYFMFNQFKHLFDSTLVGTTPRSLSAASHRSRSTTPATPGDVTRAGTLDFTTSAIY